MICIKSIKRFCKDDISKIKNYDLAIADDTQMWECHHINELTFTRKELMKMNMYYHRPADELIFLTHSEHYNLHHFGKIYSEKSRQKMSESHKGKTHSDFGRKFKEHFGIISIDNLKLYNTELYWYKRHNNKCRWE